MKKIIIPLILILLILLNTCAISDDSSTNKEWHVIDTWSGFIYNGTVSTSITYSKNFDGKIFNISEIKPDGEYHWVSSMMIVNTGTLFEEIKFNVVGPVVLYNYKEKNDTLKQILSAGDRPNIENISMKMFVGKNSTENNNYLTFTSIDIAQSIDLGIIAPCEEIQLFFYIKSYREIISGEYKMTSEFEINSVASPTPIFEPNFELFDIKGDEFIFILDFFLVLSSDVSFGDIIISYPNCDMCQHLIINPIHSGKSNYHIKTNLKVDGDSFDYPFDSYLGVIELTVDNEYNTKYINSSLDNYNKSITTKDWNITISADGNLIYFNFERNHERQVFWLIFIIDCILFIFSLIIIFLYWINKIKLNPIKTLRTFPWVSLIFFGLDYITFYSPEIFAKGPLILGFMCVVLFIIQLFIHMDKRKKRFFPIMISFCIIVLTILCSIFSI